MSDPQAWGSPDAGARPEPPAAPGVPGWSGTGWQPGGGFGYVAPYKPGVIPLRPLGVGEILDGAFASVRQNPGATFGLSALVIVAEQLIALALNLATRNTTDGARIGSSYGVTLVSMVSGLVLAGVLTPVVSEAVLGGRTAGAQARARLRGRVPGLIALTVTVALLSLLGLIGLIVGAVVVWVFLALATPAYVLERIGIRAALRRSRDLVRHSWWRTLGILLLAAIVTGVIQAVVTIPLAIAGLSSGGITLSDQGASVSATLLVVDAVVGMVIGTLVQPVAAGVTVLLYIDQRMRREGLDVTLAQSARARTDESPADRLP